MAIVLAVTEQCEVKQRDLEQMWKAGGAKGCVVTAKKDSVVVEEVKKGKDWARLTANLAAEGAGVATAGEAHIIPINPTLTLVCASKMSAKLGLADLPQDWEYTDALVRMVAHSVDPIFGVLVNADRRVMPLNKHKWKEDSGILYSSTYWRHTAKTTTQVQTSNVRLKPLYIASMNRQCYICHHKFNYGDTAYKKENAHLWTDQLICVKCRHSVFGTASVFN